MPPAQLKVVIVMATVKMQIISADTNNNKITTNVPYISPNASNANINLFAQKLMQFSRNTLISVYKITTEDVTNEEVQNNG